MSLLPQCSQAPTERHGSPVEAVLSGSEVALPGLIEIHKSPQCGMSLLTKANTINTLEGSRLQPGDALDALRPACIGHQPYTGTKGEPDGRTENQMNSKDLREVLLHPINVQQ